MSVSGVNSMYLLQQYVNNETADASTASSFRDVLKNEILNFGTSEQTSSDAYATQYEILSNMLADPSNMSGILLAAMLRFGAGSGSGENNIGSILSQFAGNPQMAGLQSMTQGSKIKSQASAEYTASVENAEGIIPYEAWKPVYPSVTSDVYNRSPQLYSDVINQFEVETKGRYAVNKNGHIGTYCNIFVWDVTRAMGAEIPHYYDAKTGEPMKYGDDNANQMTANRMYDWLHKNGENYGWFKVSAQEAQELANQGRPVVTALRNLGGGHGHVQVVCPSKDGQYDDERGVTIAQAGRHLTSYRPITEIYNASLPKVTYFAHM